MRFLPLALLLVAGAFAALTPQDQRLLGLDHGAFMQGAAALALGLWMLMTVGRRPGRARASAVVGGAVTWAALLAGLIGLYSYRAEFADFAERVIAELNPGEPQIGAGGEVIISRRLSGEFVVAAKINGAGASLLFDTGASSVVLTADDARRAGINPVGLDYAVEVSTANGSAAAAEVRLQSVTIGTITQKNVRALVAKPGALSQSLLGMTFLEKLKSYGVERGKLVLKGA